MDTDNRALKAWQEGGWVEGGKEGGMGDICNTVNNKNKFKKSNCGELFGICFSSLLLLNDKNNDKNNGIKFN